MGVNELNGNKLNSIMEFYVFSSANSICLKLINVTVTFQYISLIFDKPNSKDNEPLCNVLYWVKYEECTYAY